MNKNGIVIIVIGVYLIAVVLSFVKRDKLSGSPLRYLPYFLLFDFLSLITSATLALFFGMHNVWLLNLTFNFNLLFFFFLYYHLIKNQTYKKVVLYLGIIYETFFIGHFIYSGNWNILQELPFFLGTLLAIIAMMLFILDMLNSDAFLNIHEYTVFWVTVAFLFYLVIPFPLSFGLHLFSKYESELLIKAYLIVQEIANLMMYLTLIFGFLWSNKRYN